MARKIYIVIFIAFLLLSFGFKVYAESTSTTSTSASGDRGDEVIVCIETDEDGKCIDPSGDSWIKEVFGESLILNILKPKNYWEGETGIFSLLSMILANGFVILFLATIFAIGYGLIKLIGSEGDQSKLDSAKKWIKNSVIGFAVVLIAFVGVNVLTFMLDVGSVFDLAENMRVCGKGEKRKVLFMYKKEDKPECLKEKCNCTCNGDDGWSCNLST